MPPLEPAPYLAAFIDAAGNTLTATAFDVAEMTADESDGSRRGMFVIPVPEPGPEAVRLKILHKRQELASVHASSNAPVVEIREPVAGARLDGDEVTIGGEVATRQR